MERIRTVRHRGTEVLVVDYTDLRDEAETLRVIRDSAALIQRRPAGSVRVLMSVAGVRFNPAVVAALRQAGVANEPHLRAVAVTGLSGLLAVIHRTMSRLMSREIPDFATEDEALDWLALADPGGAR